MKLQDIATYEATAEFFLISSVI